MQAKQQLELLPLTAVFSSMETGDYHAASRLNPGEVPLISSTEQDHGVIGYFDIPEKKTYHDVVTIACNGQPLSSFYHPYKIAAKDDVFVCIPKDDMQLATIRYTVAYLNSMKWRFSWARKCYKNKVNKLRVAYPVSKPGAIDQDALCNMISVRNLEELMPRTTSAQAITEKPTFVPVNIEKLFQLERGDFHSLAKLERGKYPTVSRVSTNNGIVGHYKKPARAHIYPPSLLTVSTVTGDTFFQMDEFMSTDNVVICIPHKDMRIATRVFIQAMLNRMKWRYSYGRQCYKGKLAQVEIPLPVTPAGEIDEEFIESVVKGTAYWQFIESRLSFTPITVQNFTSTSGKSIKPKKIRKVPLEAFSKNN